MGYKFEKRTKEVQKTSVNSDYEYYLKYKRNINKFIFAEGNNLTVKEYIGLQEEKARIDDYLSVNQKFL